MLCWLIANNYINDKDWIPLIELFILIKVDKTVKKVRIFHNFENTDNGSENTHIL